MKIHDNILKLKNITPLSKLILGLIHDTPPVVLKFAGGYDNTCGDIGIILGTTRKLILQEFWVLEELNLITSKVGYRSRTTNITQHFKDLLKAVEMDTDREPGNRNILIVN